MIRTDVNNEYFSWLCSLVTDGIHSKRISFRKLLSFLHEKTFRYSIRHDEDRAENGVSLRYRYAVNNLPSDIADDIYSYIDGPCSVLEMMVALAVHCEENIMDNPEYGDRTKQWFWGMISNLGLAGMSDDQFDRYLVDEAIERLLDRTYEPDGRGGLFYIRRCEYDLRRVEIWHQLCWYLDSITEYR